MDICPKRLRAMVTSLPTIARPEAWRDYYETATGFRSNPHGADTSASTCHIPSRAMLAGV
jgi:hypothetical protein